MLRFISHLFNAAVIISLAGLAWNIGAARFGQAEARNNLASLVRQLAGADAKAAAPGAPGSAAALPAALSGFAQTTALPPPAPLVSTNPQGAVALPVPAPERQGTKAQDRTEAKAVMPDQSDAKSSMAAAETTRALDTTKLQSSAAAGLPSAIPPRTEKKVEGDVIVPPIRRQKPADAQAIARLGQKPLNGNSNGKDALASAKTAKSTAKGTVVRAANSAAGAPKKRIDVAGRSSLGAADQPTTASSGRGNCNQGLRFDARSSRCVPLPSPTAVTPLRVRGTP